MHVNLKITERFAGRGCLLLLLHVFLAFFQPVAFTLDIDNGAVMEHPIENGGSNGNISKDFVPLGKSLIGGKDS